MNKNNSVGGLLYHSLKKLLLTMRIAIFLLLVGFLQTKATDTYSQNTKLSISVSNTELVKILDKIENQSEFYFLYNEKLIDATRKVTIEAKDERIEDVLKNLFSGTDVQYSIIDRKIILAPAYLSESQQQGKKIVGKVTGQSGESLPGVTVVVKGTTKGITTDNEGNFALQLSNDDKMLIFSFIGMKTQELTIGTQTSMAIVMIEDAIHLDEVVAIGYGTMTKKALTASVGSLKAADLVDRTSAFSILEGMAGKVAGVRNVSFSGKPGGASSLRIRGMGSINANSDPIYVLDGVVGVDPQIINSANVESIDILKDAAATAMY